MLSIVSVLQRSRVSVLVGARWYGANKVLDSAATPDKEEPPVPPLASAPSSSSQSARGEQARGAMREYLKKIGSGAGVQGSSSPAGASSTTGGGSAAPEGSVWARIRKDVAGTVTDSPNNRAPPSSSRTTNSRGSFSFFSPPSSSSSPSSQQSQQQRRPRPSGTRQPNFDRPSSGTQQSTGSAQVADRRPRQSGDVVTRSPVLSSGGPPRGAQSENMRAGGNKKRKPGGPGGNKARRVGGEGRLRDDESGGGGSDIPEAIRALLFDHEMYFEKHARAGKMIDTSEMDGIDKFLADFYMESSLVKGDSNEYRTVIESPSLRRAKIPVPRAMHQLVQSMQPQIYAAPTGSMGYELGATAWEVVSKNTYYNDGERDYLANGIARETEKVLTFATKMAKSRVGEMDLVFQPGFRKGLVGIEDEKRRRALEDVKPVDSYAQAATDWKVEAVVDEDQL